MFTLRNGVFAGRSLHITFLRNLAYKPLRLGRMQISPLQNKSLEDSATDVEEGKLIEPRIPSKIGQLVQVRSKREVRVEKNYLTLRTFLLARATKNNAQMQIRAYEKLVASVKPELRGTILANFIKHVVAEQDSSQAVNFVESVRAAEMAALGEEEFTIHVIRYGTKTHWIVIVVAMFPIFHR